MKIGIFIDRASVGGGQARVVANLCHAWSEVGWEVHLITTDGCECSYPIPSSVVRHSLLGRLRRRGVMRQWDNMLIAIRLGKIAHHARLEGMLAISAVESVLLALARCPSAMTKLGSEHVYARHYPMPYFLGLCRKHVYPLLDGIVCPASQSVQALKEDCPRANAILIPNLLVPPLAEDAAPHLVPLTAERRRFVSCGRLEFDKGFEDVIDAFARIAGLLVDWDLVIIGNGPAEDALRKRVQDKGLDGRVVFTGYSDQAHKYYEACHVFVYASPKEGFGMVIAEAQGSGLPVICYDCLAGPRDIVKDGETGFLIKQGVIDAFAQAMHKLATDGGLRSQMASQAKNIYDRLGAEAVMPVWHQALKFRAGTVAKFKEYA